MSVFLLLFGSSTALFVMRKCVSIIIALILLFPLNLYAKEVEPDLQKVVISYYKQSENPESEAYKSWKAGMLKEYALDLHKIIVTIEFLEQDEKDDQIGVSIVMTAIGYGIAFNNQKKRIISVRGIVVFIDKITKKVLGGMTFFRNPNKILEGWNERDV